LIKIKIFLISLILSGTIPPLFADSILSQKSYAASIIGGYLCELRKGSFTRESFILAIEDRMIRRGYDTKILYDQKVKRAGKFIADKLGSSCNNGKFYSDRNFQNKFKELLY
tara:strand:+ start:305 stop:640 length:336 start_codon:yes stop_codon:yes gene_type:complete